MYRSGPAQSPADGDGSPIDVRGPNFRASLVHGTVVLTGELDVATAAVCERALIQAEAHVGPDPLIVDLRALEFMAAAGITVLVAAGHRARTAGRLLIVIPGTGAPARTLRLCGLDPTASPLRWPAAIARGGRFIRRRRGAGTPPSDRMAS